MTVKGTIDEATVCRLEESLSHELPRFAVAYKDESHFQQWIARLIWVFNRHYLTRYTTVMFGRVYFPSRKWRDEVGPEQIYNTLRHEAVHLRDARRFPVLFQFSYLFFLPTVLTVRAVWEWRAYLETLRVHVEIHGEIPESLLERIQNRFTGPDYLFMFPFPKLIRRWLEAARRRLEAE